MDTTFDRWSRDQTLLSAEGQVELSNAFFTRDVNAVELNDFATFTLEMSPIDVTLASVCLPGSFARFFTKRGNCFFFFFLGARPRRQRDRYYFVLCRKPFRFLLRLHRIQLNSPINTTSSSFTSSLSGTLQYILTHSPSSSTAAAHHTHRRQTTSKHRQSSLTTHHHKQQQPHLAWS